jgi:hypothetical protein
VIELDDLEYSTSCSTPVCPLLETPQISLAKSVQHIIVLSDRALYGHMLWVGHGTEQGHLGFK